MSEDTFTVISVKQNPEQWDWSPLSAGVGSGENQTLAKASWIVISCTEAFAALGWWLTLRAVTERAPTPCLSVLPKCLSCRKFLYCYRHMHSTDDIAEQQIQTSYRKPWEYIMTVSAASTQEYLLRWRNRLKTCWQFLHQKPCQVKTVLKGWCQLMPV